MKITAFLAACALLPLGAQATVYSKIIHQESEVRFHYQQMGVEMQGVFGQVDGTINFNSEAPDNSRVELYVVLDSVDTGLADANTELSKPEWLDSKALPQAKFQAQSIVAIDKEHYEVKGVLTIKDQSKNVRFTALLSGATERPTLSGELPIKRADFNIGEGAWSGFDVLANEVRVQFKIVIA